MSPHLGHGTAPPPSPPTDYCVHVNLQCYLNWSRTSNNLPYTYTVNKFKNGKEMQNI